MSATDEGPETQETPPDGANGEEASAAEPESAGDATTDQPGGDVTEGADPTESGSDGAEGSAASEEGDAATAGSATATTAAAADPATAQAPDQASGSIRSGAALRAERAAAARAGSSNGLARYVKRYGPFVAVIIIVAGAIAIFGGGGGGGGDDDNGGGQAETQGGNVDEEDLIRSGPMTPQKADLLGEDVDFGPNCDTATGRIKLPTLLAPPCVEPFTGDNGGDTAQGVTADAVKIIRYRTDPALDPLGASIAAGGGADVNPETLNQALENYTRLYQSLFETYGRKVDIEVFTGTGASDDREAAKADAITIAEKKPFAVIGSPAQSTTIFATELAARGVICAAGCSIAEPEEIVNQFPDYIWNPGPTPDQSVQLASEVIGNLAGPGKAELAGDDATKAKDRVYALVHYDTPDGDHEPVFHAFKQALSDNGIELATDVEFSLDLAKAQENARTIISRLKQAGVTTVLYYGDPFTPGPLTEEATAQNYHPEWILGPNVLADSTFFARMMDGEQWSHGFGMSFIAGRGTPETGDAWHIYRWAFGEDPPNNTIALPEAYLRGIFTAIHLAGPDLTPETFRDSLYRAPPVGGGPTEPLISRGDHGIWPDLDLGGSDDVTLIWWDPTASGEDEIGNQGQGMYRYAKGGERYTIGHMPKSIDEAGLFDDASSVTVYDQLPPDDTPPDYPPPDLD